MYLIFWKLNLYIGLKFLNQLLNWLFKNLIILISITLKTLLFYLESDVQLFYDFDYSIWIWYDVPWKILFSSLFWHIFFEEAILQWNSIRIYSKESMPCQSMLRNVKRICIPIRIILSLSWQNQEFCFSYFDYNTLLYTYLLVHFYLYICFLYIEIIKNNLLLYI